MVNDISENGEVLHSVTKALLGQNSYCITQSVNDFNGCENVVQSGIDSGHASNSSSPESSQTSADKLNDTILACLNESMLRVRVIAPGTEPFELQVSSCELVQEIHQLLLEREATCHRTCFSLQMNGIALDGFTEIRIIPDFRDGCVLKVVEAPYTTREARIHIRHVRELLRGCDAVDAVNGIDGASLSYLVTTIIDRKKTLEKSMICTPPDYILPDHEERHLLPLLPSKRDSLQALKSLSISPYNPPPGHRKIKGDVLYLIVETMEGGKYHITCCTNGFYVNATTSGAFRPDISSSHKYIHHSLVDLLSSLSSQFKRTISILIKMRIEKQILERLPTPYQIVSWIAPAFEQTADGIRAEDCTQPHRIGLEDHVPGQIRDWNEELQTTHEMPRETIPEKVVRQRAIFKIHSDFVSAAIKGAIAVIEGNVIAINPADEPRTHMYIWNNIFFSLGFDVKDHYKELGGDAAAHAATSNDLQGVQAYNQLDNQKLCTLGMVIVDYKGFRVTAQSIIPGILEREQEQSVVYGSVDFGKTVVCSPDYQELLAKSAEQLKILPHEVKSGKDGEVVKLYSSFETKGIAGNDSRHYVLDLLRTFPPDVNFLEGAEVTDLCKAKGFPRPFPHKLASLRHELVDSFTEHRYLLFIRSAAHQVQQMQFNSSNDLLKNESATVKDIQDVIISQFKSEIIGSTDTLDDQSLPEAEVAEKLVNGTLLGDNEIDCDQLSKDVTKQIISAAAQQVGSISPDAFEIRFNPDCYCTTVSHAETEDLAKQRSLIAEAAEFLLVQQLPNFIRDCLQHILLPVDGASLSNALHSRGINIRYLGKLIDSIQDVPKLQYLRIICAMEVMCRSAKHIYCKYIQPVPPTSIAMAIAHFLNCLLSSSTNPVVSSNDEVSRTNSNSKRSKASRRKKKSSKLVAQNDEWMSTSSKLLWNSLQEDLKSYYAYISDCDNVDVYIKRNCVQKTSVLRRFAQMVGIQILMKDYDLETSKRSVLFVEDEIQNIYPVFKHVDPRSSDANNLFIAGQAKVQHGALRMGYDMVADSLNMMNNVYGAMHMEMGQCMRVLARLSYILGDSAEALAQQHKATLISERCGGLDCASTIAEYISLAHFSFANFHVLSALRLLYRARYLMLLVHGNDHPLFAQIDGNIGVMLYALQEPGTALRFLEYALKMHKKYSELNSLKTALIYHMLAAAQACVGDFRSALQMEKETFSIYIKTFGEEHEKTKESSASLKYFTREAVNFQKRINEASRRGLATIDPFVPDEVEKMCRPSLPSILEVLNIINGIIFLQFKNSATENDMNDKAPIVDANAKIPAHKKNYECTQLKHKPHLSHDGGNKSYINNGDERMLADLKLQEEALD